MQIERKTCWRIKTKIKKEEYDERMFYVMERLNT